MHTSRPSDDWLCTDRHQLRLAPCAARIAAGLSNVCETALGPRLHRQTWVRYRLNLARTEPSPAVPTPVTQAFIDELAVHPWKDQPQIRTALNLWQHGLRGGYVWLRDGRPLCMQWLFSHHDNHRLQRLPNWSGMYPPLAPDHGQVECLLTLPAGLRYPGGAAIPFAHAMFRLAASRGMRRLITHIHESNTAALRWAQRTGWTAYGRIHRCQIDLPLLRRHLLYLHDTAPPPVPAAAPAVTRHQQS